MRHATSVLIALAVFIGVTWASPYSKACNQGPEYWCVNYRHAEECGAVGHCLQTVWTLSTYAIDQDVVALKFTKLFEHLKHRHGNYNDEELESMVESACSSVPHVLAGQRCQHVLGGRAAELKVLLGSQLTPGALCSVMSLCNDHKMDQLLATPKHKKAEKLAGHKSHLIGGEKCTWGPSYWCANISNSHDCGATRHCVDRVWSRTAVKADNDSVCNICLDMVKQARDQLQSNETQEELKEVFEGSCNLIPIKVVSKECRALVDQFVPELVETLSSEMNPQQVCSVAGLCNNARIDALLHTYEQRKTEQDKSKKDCSGCHRVVSIARNNFDNTKYEDFLTNLLKMCRHTGSFSDSCSMLAFSHYEELISSLKRHWTPEAVCHVSGQCAGAFHSHEDSVQLSTAGTTGVVTGEGDDELPCELCEQLVKHLRDVLVANTTETEFYTVLKGICKQTGNFKDECLSLVEQWYPVIYNYLQSDLKPHEVCVLIGVCQSSANIQDTLIAPLVNPELTVKVIAPSSKLIGADEASSYQRVKIPPRTSNVRVLSPQPSPLPVERMFLSLPQSQFQNKEGCVLCQYILHFVQVEVSDEKNENKIKAAVEKACDALPKSMSDECDQFVEAYGPAIIALLVQEIDPSSVCPALNICPKTSEVKLRESATVGKSSCPLCLFAVEELETVLRDNKTEARVRAALERLCRPLKPALKPDCEQFVDQYSDKLVEMLLADLNAQEICVYLKLCQAQTEDPLSLRPSIALFHERPDLRGDENHVRKRPHARPRADEKHTMIETNEIPDSTVNGEAVDKPGSSCVICEFVLKEIDSQIKDKKNEEEVKHIVHNICNVMPKSVSKECNRFVDKYADLVISLLAQELDPDEVCRELTLCPDTDRKLFKDSVLDCAVCETVVTVVDKVLANPKVDHRVVQVMEKSCAILPAKYHDRCTTLMEIYGNSIIQIVTEYGAKGTCHRLNLCGELETAYLDMQQR